MRAEEGDTGMHGVYGGVQFGLGRFTVGARPATLSATSKIRALDEDMTTETAVVLQRAIAHA